MSEITFDISNYNLDGTLRSQNRSFGDGFNLDYNINTNYSGNTGGGANTGGGNPFASGQAMNNFQMAQGVGGILQGLFGRKKRKREQRAAAAELSKRQKVYEAQEYKNLAGDLTNPYAKMNNPFEDLTVNTQQAEFMAQQMNQNQANTMSALSGAAGSSGIAGLAQALMNQNQIGAQKASASIGMQEAQNRALQAKGEMQMEMATAKGQQMTDIYKFKGAEQARTLENNRVETLFGMAMKRKGRADQAIQSANAALYGGIGNLATQYLTGGMDGMGKKLTSIFQ